MLKLMQKYCCGDSYNTECVHISVQQAQVIKQQMWANTIRNSGRKGKRVTRRDWQKNVNKSHCPGESNKRNIEENSDVKLYVYMINYVQKSIHIKIFDTIQINFTVDYFYLTTHRHNLPHSAS